jgi:hypothetical protein
MLLHLSGITSKLVSEILNVKDKLCWFILSLIFKIEQLQYLIPKDVAIITNYDIFKSY